MMTKIEAAEDFVKATKAIRDKLKQALDHAETCLEYAEDTVKMVNDGRDAEAFVSIAAALSAMDLVYKAIPR